VVPDIVKDITMVMNYEYGRIEYEVDMTYFMGIPLHCLGESVKQTIIDRRKRL
jgi:hypothetical protein